jgi:hypothetical protein
MPRSRRRRDHLEVVAVREHLAAAPLHAVSERGVDVPGRGDLEALHPAGKRSLVLGLDEHMHVGTLQADVHDPKPLAQRRGDRGVAHRLVQLAPPQAADRRRDPHHDVQRVIRLELRPRLVPFPRARTSGLSPGAAPLAAAPEQLLLDVSPVPRALRLRRPHGSSITTRAAFRRAWGRPVENGST